MESFGLNETDDARWREDTTHMLLHLVKIHQPQLQPIKHLGSLDGFKTTQLHLAAGVIRNEIFFKNVARCRV